MNVFTGELEAALDAASERTSSPELFVDEQTKTYVGVDEFQDDEIITFNGLPREANEVYVYTLDDLRELLSDPLLWGDHPVQSWQVESWVRHEGQHADAAAKLAATGINFGVNIVSKTNDSVGFNPFFRFDVVRTTKLGMAAICAHPVDPSPGDKDDIKKLGFSGPTEVAHRSLDYNYSVLAGDREGPYLPVSLACSSLAIGYAAEKSGRGNCVVSDYFSQQRMQVVE